ncbi:MAG: molybdenum cofactor guanylyltransferase [Anaerolineae bacterium]|nr:molybdenum cofactor guanylyltransferase [Anaerolineae bacterium]MDK1118086.1 molybdenum cofactor guanylyltransferase [Anaerolineae bacterium]
MLSIAIQAGGASKRMGRDKALMPFLGRPLIQHVVDRISAIADEMLVTTNRPKDYRFLNLPLFQDLKPGRGALGGLYTALASATGETVAVVACDMPFASKTLIETAHKMLLQEELDVVVPNSSDGLEPLHAVYKREPCLLAIETAIEADKWRLISWFDNVNVYNLKPDEVKALDPSGLAFWNLNTPEEFAEAERRAQENL